MYILLRTFFETEGFILSLDSPHGDILIDNVDYIRDVIKETTGEGGVYYEFNGTMEQWKNM